MRPSDSTPACIEAAGVIVAIPAAALPDYAGFPTVAGPPDVEVRETDPVLLSGAVTSAAVERSRYLCAHAAVVHGAAGAVIVPGHSGLGKSTLAAALTLSGYGYGSDEALIVDAGGRDVLAFPRPLTLSADSRRLLGLPAGVDELSDTERIVPVAALGAFGPYRAAPAAVLLAHRRPGPPTLAAERRGAAVAALVEASFNHFRAPRAHLAAITDLVRRVEVIRVGYDSAVDLATVLSSRFAP